MLRIGSITKAFTGQVLAGLAQRGTVRLSDRLQDRLGWQVKVPERGGKPICAVLTPGQRHEASQVGALLATGAVKRPGRGRPRRRPARVAGDKGYTGRPVRSSLRRQGIGAVIPRRTTESRRGVRFDRDAYRERNRVERLINRLKQHRASATRYEKLEVSYHALLTIAAVAGCAVMLQEHALKSKRQLALARQLPSIADSERLEVHLLTTSGVVLAAGLATGMATGWVENGQLLRLDHKTVLSLLTLAAIIGLLITHRRTGIRGRRAARLVLVAYVLLTLAYPGVKFVTDILIG